MVIYTYFEIKLKALGGLADMSLPNIYTFDGCSEYSDDFVNKIIACINPEFQLELINPARADDVCIFVVDTNIGVHKLEAKFYLF